MAFVFAQSKAVFFIPAPRAWSRRLQQARPAGATSSRIAARASAAPSRLVGPPATHTTSRQVTAKRRQNDRKGVVRVYLSPHGLPDLLQRALEAGLRGRA